MHPAPERAHALPPRPPRHSAHRPSVLRAAAYTLEPSVSAAFAELPEPLKRAVEVLFKRCAAAGTSTASM